MAKARDWRDVRADAIARGQVNDNNIAVAHHHLQARVGAYRLREVREALDRRQQELADIMHVDQSRVSRIESGDFESTEIGTIRSYVEALGGSLEVVAKIDDERLELA